MANGEDELAAGEDKRKLCKELALLFKAQAIVDGFLVSRPYLLPRLPY